MDNSYSNIRFYTLCRYKLKASISDIYNEVITIFGNKFLPEESQLRRWTNSFSNLNELKLCQCKQIDANLPIINAKLQNDLFVLNDKHLFDTQSYENKIKELELKISCLKAAPKQKTIKKNTQLVNEINVLKKELEKHESKSSVVEENNSQLKRLINEYFEPKLAKQTDEIASLKKDMIRNQNELVELSDENTRLKNDLAELKNLKKELTSSQSINLDNQQQLLKLIACNLRMQKELDETRKEIESQTKLFNEKINQEISEKNKLKEKADDLEAELEQLDLALSESKRTNADLQELLSNKEDNCDMKPDLSEFKVKTSEKMIQLENEIKSLNFELSKKAEVIKRLIEKANRLEVELTEFKIENEQLKNSKTDLNAFEIKQTSGVKREMNTSDDCKQVKKKCF